MSYKILSLDGGGSWALIQARVLKDIYGDIEGHALLRQFDMVIANSGGSLVLASLCNNMKLSDIITVFESYYLRKQVFSELTFLEKLTPNNILSLLRRFTKMGPKYSTKRKLTGLVNVLKEYDTLKPNGKLIIETPLKDIPAIIKKESLQIIITGFDYFRERVNFFRSNTKSEAAKFSNQYTGITLVYAIHASSNAPVNYFDEPAEIEIEYPDDKRKTWFWDGAVAGFNNPVLAGLTEALTNNAVMAPGVTLQDYCILSIGTGTGSRAILTDYWNSTNPSIRAVYTKNINNPLVFTNSSIKFLHGVKKMAKSILSDPPDAATFIAYAMLDPLLSNSANIVRINPCVEPVKNEAGLYVLPPAYEKDTDGLAKFIALLDLDMDAVKEEEVTLITELCNKFIVADTATCVPNQLIRGKKDGPFILGQATYKEAKDKWVNHCK